MSSTNKIIKKIYLRVSTQLASPISIACGDGDVTDNDVLRNASGEFFVPGTSLAGAMRAYLSYRKDTSCVFGFSKGEDGFMSKVFVSDMCFDGNERISVRDGVALNEEKLTVSGAKFDHEIVETGLRGAFTMELVIREKDEQNEDRLVSDIKLALGGIHNGEIRFGYRKNRGLGRVAITKVQVLEITAENARMLLEKPIEEWLASAAEQTEYWTSEKKDKFIKITMPVKQCGGISIRRYHAKKNEPDFEHITCNGEPIIPGGSLSGAIRSGVREILNAYRVGDVSKKLDIMFGAVELKSKKAWQSEVVVDESIIKGAKKVLMTRTQVSRFEHAARAGALYSELSYAGGATELSVSVRRYEDNSTDWMVGVLLVVFEEIRHGMLAIGGQTAIGRGTFEANGEIAINGVDCGDREYYLGRFLEFVKEEQVCN